MVTLGTDAHKRSHTIVAADEQGRQVGQVTVKATPEGHLRGLRWAGQWAQRRWAIEDCRHLSRRLERDLLAAGEPVVRVPPKLMAGARRGARTRGKSDRSTPWSLTYRRTVSGRRCRGPPGHPIACYCGLGMGAEPPRARLSRPVRSSAIESGSLTRRSWVTRTVWR
jgi:hypothetical protein